MKILWLKTELLHPVDKGGKIRTYNMLRELKRNHEITYVTLDDGIGDEKARQRADEYCHKLVCIPHQTRPKFSPGFYLELFRSLSSTLPYTIQKYASGEMQRSILDLDRSEIYDILVCDFLTPSVNVPNGLHCPSVLFQHNVEALIWKRYYENENNPFKRMILLNQWKKLKLFEGLECQRYDCVIAVSKEDRATLKQDYNLASVFDIPTGVDTDYFRPQKTVTRELYDLVFTGSMDWLPNLDAIQYFTDQIFNKIRSSIPNVTLTVVGRNPPPHLIELSKRVPGIRVTGRVEDVRPYLERSAVCIVPLRIGGGTRLKIYEAMAMEKAVVSTSIGAEGLPVKDGEELLLADTPDHFSDSVISLLKNPATAESIGKRAARKVKTLYGWDRITADFADICHSVL